MEVDELELSIRKILNLPACACGTGLACPELSLNLLGHPDADEAIALVQDAADNGVQIPGLLGEICTLEEEDAEEEDAGVANWMAFKSVTESIQALGTTSDDGK